MEPLYFKENKAVFSTDQIDTYGFPEMYGYTGSYYVIDSAPRLVPSYEQKLLISQKPQKPVHRYDRFERFTTCLQQLLGVRGVIGKSASDVFDIMNEEIFNYERQYMPQCMVWDRLRSALSKHKMSKFCNRIPKIAISEGFQITLPVISKRIYDCICQDFQEMEKIFPTIQERLQRKYFPNIRAVCLLLMEKYRVPNVFQIPIARTSHKERELRDAFIIFWDAINDELDTFIFGDE